MEIRELLGADALTYRTVRLRALEEVPTAFLSSPEEDAALSLEQIAARLGPQQNGFVLGAFVEGALVGTVGFARNTKLKARHSGVVWGVYVAPDQRGQGLGRALMTRCLERTREMNGLCTVNLAVHVDNDPARTLYESFGFEVWGVEPDAFRVGDRSVTEVHMRLEL